MRFSAVLMIVAAAAFAGCGDKEASVATASAPAGSGAAPEVSGAGSSLKGSNTSKKTSAHASGSKPVIAPAPQGEGERDDSFIGIG